MSDGGLEICILKNAAGFWGDSLSGNPRIGAMWHDGGKVLKGHPAFRSL